MADHSRQQSIQGNDPFRIIPEDEVKEMIQEGSRLIDTLLRQEGNYASIVQTMQLKICISKRFTEFLLYIIKLFQKAIEDKTITLKNSTRLSIISELTDIAQGLHYVLINLSNYNDQDVATTSYNASVALIMRSAIKVEDIIKGLQRKQWLRWFRSAKNISALVPVFEKITQVVNDIQCIECKEFSEFLGDVEELRASLNDIRKRVLGLETVGLSTAVLFAIGGIICLIVGGILIATPAGVPLLITGGVGVGVAFATGSSTTLCAFLACKRLDRAEVKGDRKGDKFVCNDTTELLHVQ